MTETKKLHGKVAVITGGTTGIGLAAAKLFVKEGAYVFVMGRRQQELDEAVKAIGSNVTGIQGDIAKLTDLDRLYEAVKTKGRIDVIEILRTSSIGSGPLFSGLPEFRLREIPSPGSRARPGGQHHTESRYWDETTTRWP